MKMKQIFSALALLSGLLAAPLSHAAWITAIANGHWEDATIWDSGTVPGIDDFAEIDPGFTVTVATNAIVQYIIGNGAAGGTVIMAADATLAITDPTGAYGTDQLGTLNASAPGNTVVYACNPFWAKECNYYNLTFNFTNNPPPASIVNFNNFSRHGATPMTIAGDMNVIGNIRVQEGADITINGNLVLATNASWDCSVANLTVLGDLTLTTSALLLDLDGANGANSIGGNVTVAATAIGWNISDVTQWSIGGSLTNHGTIVGKGYGNISFNGTGNIAGSKNIKIPTLTVNGTYNIGLTITLTTNTPTLNGTLVFDLAKTNKIILQSYPTNLLTFYYSGNLQAINTGAAPVSGNTYKFFSATNYGGTFSSISLPGLGGGLSWVDNLAASGSLAVTGAILGAPNISLSKTGNQLTLSWDSTTYPGYRVQAQTNSNGIGTNWSGTGSGTTSPYNITINPANPPVFFRLSNP